MMTDTGAGASEQPTDRRADDEQRCAHCAARLAPGIGWCAQCYAPIVSGGDAAPAEADAPDVPDALDVADAPRTEDAASEDGAPDTEAAAAEADRMIAGLAATSGSAGSTPGSLVAAMSSTGVRVAVGAVGLVLLSGLVLGLLTLLGMVL